MENNENNNQQPAQQSIAGFVLGLISIVAWILPLVGYPVTIVGIVLSAKAIKQDKTNLKAKIGLGLSIAGLVATLINSILGVLDAVSTMPLY